MLDGVDALLLGGGLDVDPRYFGEDPLPGLGRLEPDRDAWELALVRAALRRDIPVLALCRGVQLLNVAAGGTMYQDLSSQRPGGLKHFQEAPPWYPTHSVTVDPGSRLAAALRGEQPGDAWDRPAGGAAPPAAGLMLGVNSFHHQAVRDVAGGFRAVAVAPDGVVEAVESVGHRWVVRVQWHPEALASVGAGAAPDEVAPGATAWEAVAVHPWEAARRLFRAFVAACSGRTRRRGTRQGPG